MNGQLVLRCNFQLAHERKPNDEVTLVLDAGAGVHCRARDYERCVNSTRPPLLVHGAASKSPRNVSLAPRGVNIDRLAAAFESTWRSLNQTAPGRAGPGRRPKPAGRSRSDDRRRRCLDDRASPIALDGRETLDHGPSCVV